MDVFDATKLAKEFLNSVKNDIDAKGKIVYACLFGSFLFGTNGDNSDVDIKGVYVPPATDMFLGEYNKVINRTGIINGVKIELELWSIQYFPQLLKKGDTNAISVLYSQTCPVSMLISDNFFIKFFTLNVIKNKILHNKILGIVRYCQKQCETYSLKITRLNALVDIINILKNHVNKNLKIGDIYSFLPENDLAKKYKDPNSVYNIFEINNRMFLETNMVDYVLECLENVLTNTYGKRVKRAANLTTGNDLKALSHAFRAACEYILILKTGQITYPLPQLETIKDIKYGRYDIPLAGKQISEMLDEISLIDDGSVFNRDEPDMAYLKNVILSFY